MTDGPKLWFISGASSGFGLRIAEEALARGDRVIASSRRTAGLTALAARGAFLIDLDVTAPDDAIEAALAQGEAHFNSQPITYFVSAAGYLLQGPVEGASAAEAEQSLRVNVLGTMALARAATARLRTRRDTTTSQAPGGGGGGGGCFVAFGSLGSWRGGAGYAYYSAAKWAVSGFMESLAEELPAFGARALLVEPGYFRTGFLRGGGGNRLQMANPLTDEYRGTPVEAAGRMLDAAGDRQPGDPVKGARVIVDVITQTGCAAGRETPLRLLLGADVVGAVEAKLASTQALIDEWRDVLVSTDHDDVKA